ncbi:MAG: twin-arginine translocase subunit TatC [Anaerolineae bacterium]|nr:twin-arginine translocase subunit TatC [Anaerolineae bacterium]
MTTDDAQMSILSHIAELRRRLIIALIIWIVTTVAAAFITDLVVAWLVAPLPEGSVIVLGPTEAPIVYFRVALVIGFLLALPFILYQLYAFVRPGLQPHERRVFLLGIPVVLILFVLGMAFTFQVLIPVSLPVLMGFLGQVVSPTYSLQNYLSFVTTMVLWMGVLFQTPLVIYVIALLGFVNSKQLAHVRRVVIFIAAIFAAVVTPTTDPVTMLLVMGPFILLYEVGILLARIATRQRARSHPA